MIILFELTKLTLFINEIIIFIIKYGFKYSSECSMNQWIIDSNEFIRIRQINFIIKIFINYVLLQIIFNLSETMKRQRFSSFSRLQILRSHRINLKLRLKYDCPQSITKLELKPILLEDKYSGKLSKNYNYKIIQLHK